MIPEKLEHLFTTGTRMAEVPPDARGMPLRMWRRLELERQCNAHLRTLDPEKAPLAKKALATSRDNYGWRS